MTKRERILEKSGGKCWYCGTELNGRWHADHFHPLIRIEGEPLYPELDTEENLVPSCIACNNFKSSNSIEGYRFIVNEQFENTLKNSTGLRQLNRLGLVDMEPKPVVFWFEKQGYEMKAEHEFYGISKEALDKPWDYDPVEECHVTSVERFIISARKTNIGIQVIATDSNWEQQRVEIQGSKYQLERAAEWALRLNDSPKT